jgi:hypothetical protein
MSKEIKGKKYGRLYLESYKKSVVIQVEQEGSFNVDLRSPGVEKKNRQQLDEGVWLG